MPCASERDARHFVHVPFHVLTLAFQRSGARASESERRQIDAEKEELPAPNDLPRAHRGEKKKTNENDTNENGELQEKGECVSAAWRAATTL